jgi:uncharacterized protein YndB with AHSA1/START domain
MNGTLRTADGRCVLQFERKLAHPVEKVWRAITEPDELEHWFPNAIRADFREGGEIHWLDADGKPEMSGTVTEWEPPRRWAHVAGGETMRFELRPDGDGCLLKFTHVFDDRAGAASFGSGWDICFDGLEYTLDGRTLEWDPEAWKDKHEAYVEAFGLLEGTVEPDGSVRFERVFTAPVDEVWELLTGTEEAQPKVGEQPPLRLTNGYVPAGRVTSVEQEWHAKTLWGETGKLLEYTWQVDGSDAGVVRWELKAGPGGARITLTQSVPAEHAGLRPAALAAWHTHFELLAHHVKGDQPCWSAERTQELEKHYTERLGAIGR